MIHIYDYLLGKEQRVPAKFISAKSLFSLVFHVELVIFDMLLSVLLGWITKVSYPKFAVAYVLFTRKGLYFYLEQNPTSFIIDLVDNMFEEVMAARDRLKSRANR